MILGRVIGKTIFNHATTNIRPHMSEVEMKSITVQRNRKPFHISLKHQTQGSHLTVLWGGRVEAIHANGTRIRLFKYYETSDLL